MSDHVVSFWIYSMTENILHLYRMSVSQSGGELRCSGRVSSSCSTSDTCRVNLVRTMMTIKRIGRPNNFSLWEQENNVPKQYSKNRQRLRVTRCLALYVCFVDRCLYFCVFSLGHCVVNSSSIYGFWLPPFGIFKLFLDIYIFIILAHNKQGYVQVLQTFLLHYWHQSYYSC
jgi:hypothetical protein